MTKKTDLVVQANSISGGVHHHGWRSPRVLLVGAVAGAVLLVAAFVLVRWLATSGTLQVTGNPLAPPPRARELGILAGHTGMINTLKFSGNGQVLVTASLDQTVRIWDAANRKELGILAASGLTHGIAVSPDGRTVALAPSGNGVQFWDVASRKQFGESLTDPVAMPTFPKLPGMTMPRMSLGLPIAAMAVEFSADGRLLATGEVSGKVRFWDVESRKPVGKPLLGHTFALTALAFSGNGRVLATTSTDNTVRLWDVSTYQQLDQIPMRSGHAQSVALSPDGRVLAYALPDGTTQFWDVDNRKQLGEPISNSATSLSFSADGKRLATAGLSPAVRVWDVATREPLGDPIGPSSATTSAAYSPVGQVLATGMLDNSVRLWDMTGLS
ncbi:WD40 repeat domain-containing protein [Crossiella cryophila]|uniref:WD40 repeat protein n=1 Tax=Crossiella cryophila TaxID=43355 RepID=A0A7W7FWS8_9PSEU|nr:WD40 repeat domain-containing protein [Crossiella cryophila]MBB4681816.1 WD40 repeat protein [Crossiella cryophila]